MIRKLLVVTAAVAMPISTVAAIGATGGVAGAKSPVPPDPGVTCSVSSTTTFAAPGLSVNGQVGTGVKTTVSTTSATTFGPVGGNGCTGTGAGSTITSKTVKCTKGQPGQPTTNPGCDGVKGTEGWDSWGDFLAPGNLATLQKALKKLSFTINGIAYETKTSGATTILPGGLCGSSEVGFQLTGAVKAPKQDKGQSAVLNACFGAATGSDLVGPTFLDNINAPEPTTVATASIDPALSTVVIAGGS
jgi:hypothetical protein